MNISPEKVLISNVQFYIRNISTLTTIRPKVNLVLQKSNGKKAVAFHLKGEFNEEKTDVIFTLEALNSSIIINCFGLLEASFEQALLHHLDVENLAGIKEKVMLKYIDNVIKISSIANYEKEYQFIVGVPLKKVFSAAEYKAYQLIEDFYVLRHLLIHGSVSRNELLDTKGGGSIIMDLEDMGYQKLVKTVIKELKIEIDPSLFNPNIMLEMNPITDLLVASTFTVVNKLLENYNRALKFVKPSQIL